MIGGWNSPYNDDFKIYTLLQTELA
jgi:hypothetical protein